MRIAKTLQNTRHTEHRQQLQQPTNKQTVPIFVQPIANLLNDFLVLLQITINIVFIDGTTTTESTKEEVFNLKSYKISAESNLRNYIYRQSSSAFSKYYNRAKSIHQQLNFTIKSKSFGLCMDR